MAESIIVHFRTEDRQLVADAVEQMALPIEHIKPTWRYPDREDYTLTIYFYDDMLTEYEPENIASVTEALQGMPGVSLAIEMRRSSANKGVNDASAFALRLIGILPGVVDDAYSAIWTRQEIASFAIKSDGGFLDCYRTLQPGV
ncbi:hypothetical protein ACO0LD_30770 [Undibacterium sp. Ji83W]|uniref:hypothetical protein n=1 Tax=Undibacterium sp. Ji83W TaxID=3413043 RepID=UPI003BF1838E